MKKVNLLIIGALLLWCKGIAQSETTNSEKSSSDTLRVGSIIIVKSEKDNTTRGSHSTHRSYGSNRWKNNVSTNWLVVDLGFANHDDKTNYSSTETIAFVHGTTPDKPAAKSDFSVKTGSFNINLWLFMQRMSLYKQVVNLKYGAGIELHKYYYKSGIRYIEAAEPYVERQPLTFKRNKLAFDYVTVPMMLNINPSPRNKNGGINFSAGISVGYMYGARNKQKSEAHGKEKFSGDFNLERWKLAYMGELGLGPIQLYGSYSITPLHQYGVEQYPYAVGIRFSSW